jgi:hypothetical protein
LAINNISFFLSKSFAEAKSDNDVETMQQKSKSSAWQYSFMMTKKQWRAETYSENNAVKLKQTSQSSA